MLRGFRQTHPLVAAWLSCPRLALMSRRPPSNDLGPRFDVGCNCLFDWEARTGPLRGLELLTEKQQEPPRAQNERRLSAAHVGGSIGICRHRISGSFVNTSYVYSKNTLPTSQLILIVGWAGMSHALLRTNSFRFS